MKDNLKTTYVEFDKITAKGELLGMFGLEESTKLYCLFADPAEHSLSPALYNPCFSRLGMDAFYFSTRVKKDELGEAMTKARNFGISGFNISMPHKEAVMDLLDDAEAHARLCGGVNTIVGGNEGDFEAQIYRGYNTDISGAAMSLKSIEHDLQNKKTILLGLGGAGRAVLSALGKEGAKEVSVFTRDPERESYGTFTHGLSSAFPNLKINMLSLENKEKLKQEIRDGDILVNATNVGMGKEEGKSLIPDVSYLHERLCIMDIIYHPKETRLLSQGKEAGARCLNGLSMLYFQGQAAFKLFTGLEMPLTWEEFNDIYVISK